MRLVLILLLTAVTGCCAPSSAPDGANGSDSTLGSTAAASRELPIAETREVVMSFPPDRVDLALADWNESQQRLRYWRGCILLYGTGHEQTDGAEALCTGTYPLGDDHNLDLACLELSRVPDADELRVTPRNEGTRDM